MFRSTAAGKRLIKLTEAFNSDGFEVSRVITYKGRTGIVAESKTASNYDTGRPKKVYYLEGTAYETGFLMGSLAEEEVSRMALDFADRVVFSFIGSKVLEKIKLIQEALIKLVYMLSKDAWQALPEEFKSEIQGIYDGCKSRNYKTRVDMEHLVALNMGIDIICSRLYSGSFFKRDVSGIEPEDFRIPFLCNAFTVCGKSAGYGYFFGRDFMFPTADIFQDTAAMVIYNPVSTINKKAIPHVSITAPGMVGSISAMNLEGVAFGVNMSPGANCDPQNVGTNSLLLLRLCAQSCDDAEAAVDLMAGMKRGVSWNYIIADGRNERSCVAEAGASGATQDFSQFPVEEYKPFLPDMEFIQQHKSEPFRNGIMFRWNNYKYPAEYLDFNQQTWKYYNEKHHTDKAIYSDAFLENGYINKAYDSNCPSSYYFAPQREESDEILIATNHYIIPEMRYFAMHQWTEGIIGDKVNDIQWRYDELNRLIHEMLEEQGSIGFEDAKVLTGFLSPYGKNAGYYSGNPRSKDGNEIRIEGCASVFDLKNKIVESHYGYYCDNWVKLTLSKYFT